MTSPNLTKKVGKVHVKPNNKATIVCPECNTAKTISVKNFREKQHQIKVRCSCDHSFNLKLEFRKYFRKATSLHGNFNLEHSTGNQVGRTKVVNLSISGACFEVRSSHDIRPGRKGELIFTLDNRKQSVLYRKVIVRSVNGSRIGCEFLESNTPSKELGFYMLP